jgi:carboxyl-terminal processing protease
MHHKKEDLIKYKPEIKQFLEEEIASRYYFQNGRLEASLKEDVELEEAVNILNNKERYDKLITTILKAEKPFYNSAQGKQKQLKGNKAEIEN